MKVSVIIQSRLGSSRLPAKAALDMHGMPLLARVIERCYLASSVSEVCVATSDMPNDNIIADIAVRAGALIYRGSLDDVRDRMINAADHLGAQTILRVTGDNPVTDPKLLDALIEAKNADPDCPYLTHDLSKVVYGTAAELIDVQALKFQVPYLPIDGKEHVTTGLLQLPRAKSIKPPQALSDPYLSLTVDDFEQYQSVWALTKKFGFKADALEKIIQAWKSQEGGASLYKTRPL